MAAALITSALFANAQLETHMWLPGAQFYILIALGFVSSIAIAMSTLPLLKSTTAAENARTE